MVRKAENSTDKLEQLLSGAQLPALPQSAISLLEMAKNPANGPAEFAFPIEADPGLTSQVLRFVNSSYFGFSREISSVKLAITLVGIRTIKNFALWSAVFSLMPNPRCGPFELRCLWQDSVQRGLFARNVGRLLGISDPEAPFAAALLQDLAVPLLAKEMPEQYETLLTQRATGKQSLSQLELAAFGWTHAQAGGVIARHWNLPEAFASLIERHADLDEALSGGGDPEQVAVALAALLPAACDEHWNDCQRLEEAYQRLLPGDAPTLAVLLGQTDEQFEEFAPVLQLSAPAKSLAQRYEEATSATA